MDDGGSAATPRDFCTDVSLILDEQVSFLFKDLMETRVVHRCKKMCTFLFSIPVSLIIA